MTSTSTELCIHELTVQTCSSCSKSALPLVYVSAGGNRYHASPTCSALVEGQEHVLARGGTPAEIRAVKIGSSELDRRSRCRTCRP